jgi:anti-sigma regulatory factor (Ser/Thr protein kinase)
MQASRATRALRRGRHAALGGAVPTGRGAPPAARIAGRRFADGNRSWRATAAYLGRCEYPQSPESVGKARDTIRKALADWGISSLTDEVVLCVSEAVTNSVQHAHTPFRTVVLVAWHRESTLHVEVIDGDRHRPRRTVPLEAGGITLPAQNRLRDTGRGIFLISQLATRWGVAPWPPGKRVWFEFDTEPACGDS